MSDTLKKNDEELPPLRRFWKSRRELPSAVWDADKNKPKFEFQRGVLDTRDQDLAEELLEMGYMEVELDEGENIKPALTDFYPQADPMPVKARRVKQGHEHEPRFKPKQQQSGNLPRVGPAGSVPQELTRDAKIVEEPKPIKG